MEQQITEDLYDDFCLLQNEIYLIVTALPGAAFGQHAFHGNDFSHYSIMSQMPTTDCNKNELDLSFSYLQTQLILNNHDQYIYPWILLG